MRWMAVLAVLAGLGLSALGSGVTDLLAQSPPARVFGTVTVDGATPPQGTKVEAFINGRLCGDGVVRQLGTDIGIGYVVDVREEQTEPGCGAEGRTITFKVGGRDAPQTETFRSGAFIRLDLMVTGAIETPTPGPTPPPFGAGAASPSPTPAADTPTPAPATPTPAATASPTAPASPTATATGTGTPEATPTGTATPSPTPGGTPTVTPTPTATPTVTVTPTGTATPAAIEPDQTDADDENGGVPIFIWVLLALAVLAAAGAGLYLTQRRRGGPPAV